MDVELDAEVGGASAAPNFVVTCLEGRDEVTAWLDDASQFAERAGEQG